MRRLRHAIPDQPCGRVIAFLDKLTQASSLCPLAGLERVGDFARL